MDNEKIILELFGRVKTLEEKVFILEGKLAEAEENDDQSSPSTVASNKITRSVSRQYVMKRLEENNPQFKIEKGNRASGADIILTTKENEITYTLKAKFYHSKSHHPNYVSGWSRINKDEIANEDIAFHIFNVEYQKEYYIFFFKTADLLALVQGKMPDQNGMYYFNFHIRDGKMVESRDGDKDVSKYFNKLSIPTEFIKKTK